MDLVLIESDRRRVVPELIQFGTMCLKSRVFIYYRSTTLGCKDIGIRNLSLWQSLNSFACFFFGFQLFFMVDFHLD